MMNEMDSYLNVMNQACQIPEIQLRHLRTIRDDTFHSPMSISVDHHFIAVIQKAGDVSTSVYDERLARL
jgi:hypothetical protein